MSRSGLVNLGNTCFMNSLLQVLIDIDDFEKLFIKNSKKDNLFYFFSELYNSSRVTNNNVINPQQFHKALQDKASKNKNNIFVGYNQNDPSELLMFLLDNFHDEIKREVEMKINGTSKNITDNLAIKCYEMKKKTLEKSYSEIYNLFYFIEINQIKNTKTNVMEYVPQWSSQLSLPLVNKSSMISKIQLKDCIKYYAKENIIDDQNKSMKFKFWDLPNILVIVLQRFSSTFHKNNILVEFPLDDLDMSSYIIGYNSDKYLYELVGVCNHMGSINGGHYTSFSKKNDKWTLYNDSQSHLVKPENVISNNAYCLFYKKKT